MLTQRKEPPPRCVHGLDGGVKVRDLGVCCHLNSPTRTKDARPPASKQPGGRRHGRPWLKLGLGVILLVVAVSRWHADQGGGDEPQLPGWMAAVDSFSPAKATGLAVILAVANPKNLALTLAAGVTIGGAGLTPAENVVATAAFTVIAASTVAGPVLGYRVAKDRMAELLADLKARLIRDNKTIMTVVLVVLSFVLLGKGLAGLL
ncbi:GAP family protein [Saccharopolyspora mangrovi]|uniref:GAP family protein n=1 Tax=Saccharopolyspora mangrovi TaxID=3082379 RepID=A0ABU6ABR0_9PSEU|nr:GAP family protein [Saccharopolyspora sp. S2-29]MEB3368980.1 GAP family protein [Saccharopolyspora sp. S2-29]